MLGSFLCAEYAPNAHARIQITSKRDFTLNLMKKMVKYYFLGGILENCP